MDAATEDRFDRVIGKLDGLSARADAITRRRARRDADTRRTKAQLEAGAREGRWELFSDPVEGRHCQVQMPNGKRVQVFVEYQKSQVTGSGRRDKTTATPFTVHVTGMDKGGTEHTIKVEVRAFSAEEAKREAVHIAPTTSAPRSARLSSGC